MDRPIENSRKRRSGGGHGGGHGMPAGRQEPRSGWSAGSGRVSDGAGAGGVVPGGDEFERRLGVSEGHRELGAARQCIDEPLELAGVLRPRRRQVGPRLFGFLGERGAPELEGPRPRGRVVRLGGRGDGHVVEVPHELRRLARRARVTFIVTRAPSAVRPMATAQSSVSTSLTRVVVIARSSTSGPAIHVSRSWLWIEWLRTQPPRSPPTSRATARRRSSPCRGATRWTTTP